MRAPRDHGGRDHHPHGGQQQRPADRGPGMRPVSGQPALGEDENQRAQPENLGFPGITELDPGPRLAQGQAKADEDQQGRKAQRVREPRRHDGGYDGPGPGQ